MRRFLIVGHKIDADGYFNLDDLPGSGRMDIMAMATSSALFLSHGLRKDVEVWLLFLGGGEKLMKIIGEEARCLFPDERNMAAAIRNALIRHKLGKKMMPGIYINSCDFRKSIAMAMEDSELFYLKEEGENIADIEFPKESTFILGDHMDLSPEEEKILLEASPTVVSLGKKSLHTYQSIVIVNYELDRRERYGNHS